VHIEIYSGFARFALLLHASCLQYYIRCFIITYRYQSINQSIIKCDKRTQNNAEFSENDSAKT